MKGKEWYREEDIAEEYEPKRFSGSGGSHINSSEKESVKKALGNIENKKVLEVAAGTGRFTLMAAKQGAKITACDISEPMLDIARKKAKKEDLDNIDFLKVDAENLPFKENKFDTVFAVRFMHLVDDPQKFLKELARVSKKNIVFDTFSFSSFRILYNKLLPMGSRLYSEDEVQELAKNLDLKIDKKLEGFAIPFGVYRYAPDFIISTFKELDENMLNSNVLKNLASVTYWRLKKEGKLN
ncbi:SAM-dependent methyltransferase [archaeon SCG-AAA382B04]|nr:SAM-dependent methyltransferase [archaeon SCG-AAA382B04]